MKISIKPSGDSALIVFFGDAIDPAVNRNIGKALKAIAERHIEGLVELVPTYGTILVVYDPLKADYETMKEQMAFLTGMTPAAEEEGEEGAVLEIPVCYGGVFGPDLDHVAEVNGLTPEEVVGIHSKPAYLVYMVGFTPGFPYLGGMDERIATPRLLSPRERIPAGSVGIAGHQTGVYPLESPGGWQIIGRTPVTLFDPEKDPPALLSAGMRIRFKPVDQTAYEAMKARGEKGGEAYDPVQG